MSGLESSRTDSASVDSYRELFERSADAILILEGELFTDCNDAAVKMLRYTSKAEVLQAHPSVLSPPTQPDGRDSYEKANEMIALAFRNGNHRFEWDHKRADGEVFPVEVLLTAVQEPGRNTLHVVWRDITERKLLEDELRQALKMEAIGKLTGGIAHDFNNLLVSVIGYSEMLEEHVEEGSEAYEFVTEVRRAGERAAELVRQLLAFGRKQQLLPTVLDLNGLVRNIETLIRRVLGEQVRLEFAYAEGVLPIKADRSQIEQVLLNLAANARDAMSDGGILKVETARGVPACASPELESEQAFGECALLSFSDNGIGMDEATVERAFDPFFTTKEAGAGSGLGLATVYGIIKQSEGGVSLHSTPGAGTVIEVQLPITDEPLHSSPEVAESDAPVPGGGEVILVVEDDDSVARVVRSSLEARGYQVLYCHDGCEALALFQAHHEEIDLVLTDVIMPHMGGPELARALKQLGFDPPMLFMSGYTDDSLSPLHAEGEVNTLMKPFGTMELAERVRAALDD